MITVRQTVDEYPLLSFRSSSVGSNKLCIYLYKAMMNRCNSSTLLSKQAKKKGFSKSRGGSSVQNLTKTHLFCNPVHSLEEILIVENDGNDLHQLHEYIHSSYFLS